MNIVWLGMILGLGFRGMSKRKGFYHGGHRGPEACLENSVLSVVILPK